MARLDAPHESNWTSFRTAMTSNLLNPKVALFVLAFFPQFISPDAAGELAPFMMLGISYAAIGTVWYLLFPVFDS